MKRMLIMAIVLGVLIGRMFATQCADHNIYLSESPIRISKVKSVRCTPGTPSGGIQYNCPSGSGGMGVWGFDVQSPCVTQWVAYAVNTPDNTATNHYDLGLYYIKGPKAATLAGKLMVHTSELTGSGFAPSPGLTTVSWVGGNCSIPCTLPPGQYALALATDCSVSCAVLWGDNTDGYMYLFNVWLGGNGGTGVNPGLLPAGCPSGNPPSCMFYMSSAPGLPASITPPATDPALGLTKWPQPPLVLIF